MPPLKKLRRDSLVTDVQLIRQQVMNDNKSGSTKIKNDQVNYHYCKKVSGK